MRISHRSVHFSHFLALLELGLKQAWRSERHVMPAVTFVLLGTMVLSLGVQTANIFLDQETWSLVFWIFFLFMSLLLGHDIGVLPKKQLMFYFLIATPLTLWWVRMIQLFVWLWGLALLTLGMHFLWLDVPVQEIGGFFVVLLLTALGAAALLNTVSLLVSRMQGQGLLFAVLALPLLLPLYVFALRAGLWPLLSYDVLAMSLSLLLFPSLWKA